MADIVGVMNNEDLFWGYPKAIVTDRIGWKWSWYLLFLVGHVITTGQAHARALRPLVQGIGDNNHRHHRWFSRASFKPID